MYRRYAMPVLAVSLAVTAVFPMTAEASSNYSMRKKVVIAAGIMPASFDENEPVSRAQFAKMLVQASTYRSSVSEENNVSVFADVTRDHEYASYIRVSAEQGWMTGYLGGNFKPDQPVIMQEAVRAVLTLLATPTRISPAIRQPTAWPRRPIWSWTRI